ncbi:hypothetical protein IJF81_07375, partial [bacterium]|nr:hypothetical protein [bacterium]
MNQKSISIEELNSGEKIAIGIIEITAIPDISIINDLPNATLETIDKYKHEFNGLLNEIHQSYKTLSYSSGYTKDISIEILWTTQKVDNQPYNAKIRLFIIVRAIDSDETSATSSVDSIIKYCTSTLSLQKYDYAVLTYTQLSSVIANISDSSINAIIKEEKVENLQNQIFPYCYAFDRLPISNSDLSKIVNVLTEYPNCAISMQLIPTSFDAAESSEIDRTTQMLETLTKGVMDQGVGIISFALAEKHAQTYKYYSSHKNSSLFLYNILIYGNKEAVSNISSRVSGQISTGIDDAADLKLVPLQSYEVNKNNNFYPLPWAVNELLLNEDRNLTVWNSGQFSNSLYRIPYIITSEEAAEFFRLPIGSDRISAGLNINESGKSSKTYTANIINAGDISVGKLRSSSRGDTIGFSLKDLAKHMLIV